jgi:anti-sigma factor (TIGR02949 family)
MPPLERFTCEEMFRRLDDYVDRELPADELEQAREHLEACATCAGEYAFEASVVREVRARLARVEAPAALVAAIRTRLGEPPER